MIDFPPTHSPNLTPEMLSTKQCQMDFPAKFHAIKSVSQDFHHARTILRLLRQLHQSRPIFSQHQDSTGINAFLLRPLKGNCFQETQMANSPEQGWDRKIRCRTHLGPCNARQGKHLLQAVSDLTRSKLSSRVRREALSPSFPRLSSLRAHSS